MLNLLIVLISIVYQELQKDSVNNDYAAKNRLILEFETLKVWNRHGEAVNAHLLTATKDSADYSMKV